MRTYIRKNDTVMVIAGVSKGKKGRVLEVNRKKNRAIVEGAGMVKRHTKPNNENKEGGIIEKEAAIHISNLMLLDASGNPTRVKKERDGKNVKRVSVKTGDEIK